MSSNELLQLITAILGSGTAGTLLVFLLSRKSQLRATAADAGVKQATAQDLLIQRLQDDGATYRDEVKELKAQVDRLEARYDKAQRDFAEQLQVAHSENSRLATRVAQLQTDLDVAERQIVELRRRITP